MKKTLIVLLASALAIAAPAQATNSRPQDKILMEQFTPTEWKAMNNRDKDNAWKKYQAELCKGKVRFTTYKLRNLRMSADTEVYVYCQ